LRERLLDSLLVRRGVQDEAARSAFLEPKLKHVQAPWDLHGIDDAAGVILEAVRAGRRIAIYGDYDVDGVMATAILWHALRAIKPGLEVRTYVPHRRKEGYGLNSDALALLKNEGIDLVVTVDCGVSAVDEARHARELGLELVITDHHHLRHDGEIPHARAVVHPELGEAQRFKEICGAVVAWKLAWALFYAHAGCSRDGRLPKSLADLLLQLCSLAAVGTVADVMPLLGENRDIVANGLKVLHRTGFPGVDALLRHTRTDPASLGKEELDAEKIAFRVAPPINACGRMQHADDAVELFTTADARRAAALVGSINTLNERRRTDSGEIHEAARARWLAIVEQSREAKRPVPAAVVLHDEHWNLGIVGIVCSKLVEEHARPVILLTRDVNEGSGLYKGSGRSIPGVDMHAALVECSEHLAGFGGHAMAAGVKVCESKLALFARAFADAVARQRAGDGDLRLPLEIDCVCHLPELDIASVQSIESLRPFGRGNPRPAILIEDAEIKQTRIFGKKGEHLELTLKQRERFMRVQCWGGAGHAERLRGERVDAVLEVKLKAGQTAEVEGKLVDLRIRAKEAR
jgi:single-stranded-DNA-specific exonuclease